MPIKLITRDNTVIDFKRVPRTAVRLQIFNAHDCLLDTVDVIVQDDDTLDAEVSTALVKLLRHTWTLSVGDVIRINEI